MQIFLSLKLFQFDQLSQFNICLVKFILPYLPLETLSIFSKVHWFVHLLDVSIKCYFVSKTSYDDFNLLLHSGFSHCEYITILPKLTLDDLGCDVLINCGVQHSCWSFNRFLKKSTVVIVFSMPSESVTSSLSLKFWLNIFSCWLYVPRALSFLFACFCIPFLFYFYLNQHLLLLYSKVFFKDIFQLNHFSRS